MKMDYENTIKTFLRNGLLCCYLGVICLGLPSIAAGADAAAEQNCESCHDDHLNRSLRRRFVHMPFQEKKCRQCHTVQESHQGLSQQRARNRANTQRVQWLEESIQPAMNHYFLFSSQDVSGTVVVEAAMPQGGTSRQELTLPPVREMQMVSNDGRAPKVSNVRLIEVVRGIYIEATIAWQTDEPAKSIIEYGIGAMGIKVGSDNRLARDHRLTLSGLKRNQEYNYQILSEDRFGNHTTAGPYYFSTKGVRYQQRSMAAEYSRRGSNVKLIHGATRNNDGQVVLQIAANRAVSLSIGKQAGETNLAQAAATGASKPSHPKLKEKRDVTINTCYTCHENTKSGRSHPVNVRPRRGMTIPREYSTLSDGRMTCMSCHDDHASNMEFRLIKSSKKELCIGCHKGME